MYWDTRLLEVCGQAYIIGFGSCIESIRLCMSFTLLIFILIQNITYKKTKITGCSKLFTIVDNEIWR